MTALSCGQQSSPACYFGLTSLSAPCISAWSKPEPADVPPETNGVPDSLAAALESDDSPGQYPTPALIVDGALLFHSVH